MEKLADTLVEARPNYISRGRYDDWSIEDILKHLDKVSIEEGCKPTKTILWRRINNEGKDEPSPRQIDKWISFRAALDLIGYPDVHSWIEPDYIAWGIDFIEANQGFLPTATSLDYLSRQKRGPSAAQVGNVFGGINNYKTVVSHYHALYTYAEENYKRLRGQDIQIDLQSGLMTVDIFNGATSGNELIQRHAKYKLVDAILPDNYSMAKTKISAQNMKPDEVLEEIKQYQHDIEMSDLVRISDQLGIRRDIWVRDNSYLDALKVPVEFMEPKRIKLSMLKLAI